MPIPSIAATDAPLPQLDQADFILSDSPEPPPDSVTWRAQTLPHEWLASRPGVWGYGWYRLRFALPGEPDELYALHVPLLKGVGAVYVNGVHVGQTGTFERTASTERPANEAPLLAPGRGLFANVPRFFSVRPELLHAGANTVHLRLQVKPGASGALSRITIGPEPLVRSEYERRVFVSVTGPRMISIFSVGIGLVILLLWLRRRHESMYGYFALTALAFASSSPADLSSPNRPSRSPTGAY
jgi:hypothetical protein